MKGLLRVIENAIYRSAYAGERIAITDAGRAALARDKSEQFRPADIRAALTDVRDRERQADADATGAK